MIDTLCYMSDHIRKGTSDCCLTREILVLYIYCIMYHVWKLAHKLFLVDYTLLSGFLSTWAVFILCKDLNLAGESTWVEDYHRHVFLSSIVGASFLSIMVCSRFSAPWLDTTLLVRKRFTRSGPGEVIKASAILCGRKAVWKLDCWESSGWENTF